jgi:hypothetical protein
MADGALTIKVDPRTEEWLAERARAEGKSPEQYAADIVAETAALDLDEPPPGLLVSEETLRASIAEQLRKIDKGEAELFPHEQVMAEARAIIEAAKARKR